MGKKTTKLISIILAAVVFLVFPISPAKADSSGVCFTAVNDKVLPVSMMPVYVGGIAYVRCDVFKELGISYTYIPSDNTAMLNSGSRLLVFYLDDGSCKDGDGVSLPISATSINGAVYVPARTGKYFDLVDTIITGTGNGDLLRIKNGAQSLSDSQFLEAAEAGGLILSRYKEYTGSNGGGDTSNPSQPGVSESPDIIGAEVCLCFVGMPSAEMLDTLKIFSMNAAFFITAEEAREKPDMVRRIIGEGNTIGVYCESQTEDECARAVEAIQEAAFYIPTIMTSLEADSDEFRQYAGENGFVYYSPSAVIPAETRSASAVSTLIQKTRQNSDFCLFSGENTQVLLTPLLQYLFTNGNSVAALLETSCKS